MIFAKLKFLGVNINRNTVLCYWASGRFESLAVVHLRVNTRSVQVKIIKMIQGEANMLPNLTPEDAVYISPLQEPGALLGARCGQ